MRIACPLPEVGAAQLCRNFAFDVLDPVPLGAFFDGSVGGEVAPRKAKDSATTTRHSAVLSADVCSCTLVLRLFRQRGRQLRTRATGESAVERFWDVGNALRCPILARKTARNAKRGTRDTSETNGFHVNRQREGEKFRL